MPARFGMTFDLGGYTLDFIKSLQEMQKKMAAQPAGADNSAQSMAMLGLMQQLTFNGASIRFDDDSLTNKALDYVAKQQGRSRDDIINQAKAIVPFVPAQLNNAGIVRRRSSTGRQRLSRRSARASRSRPRRRRRCRSRMIAAGGMADPKIRR